MADIYAVEQTVPDRPIGGTGPDALESASESANLWSSLQWFPHRTVCAPVSPPVYPASGRAMRLRAALIGAPEARATLRDI